MKRRDCVKLLAGAAAAGAWPAWLRRAFGDVTVAARPSSIAPAVATLVLIIPRADDRKWDRGRAFGELLNHGSDRDLAPLALVDVVCATAASAGVEGEPLLLFVDGAAARAFDEPLPQYPDREASRAELRRPFGDEDQVSDRRIAVVSRLIRAALAGRLAADPRSERELAALARARLVTRAPRGAHWADGGSCGITVEDAPELSDQVDCGMGHVPKKSARFLYFFTRARP